jgi:catechol 2,3-dioxygenase-like lactoylglutathione lyase family enzyme
MTQQQPLPPILNVGTVFVPVANQARALSFYTDTLGLEKRFDFEYGGGQRWIEVAPSGSAHRIALVPNTEGSPRAWLSTYCALEVENAEVTHAALKSRGVRVSDIAGQGTERTGLFTDDVVVKNPVPPQFYLHDPDGNRFLVVQIGR